MNYSRAGLRKPRRRGGAAAANESSGVLAVGSDGRGEDLEEDEYKVGVLLLNLGGPETLDDVQPFLYIYSPTRPSFGCPDRFGFYKVFSPTS